MHAEVGFPELKFLGDNTQNLILQKSLQMCFKKEQKKYGEMRFTNPGQRLFEDRECRVCVCASVGRVQACHEAPDDLLDGGPACNKDCKFARSL